MLCDLIDSFKASVRIQRNAFFIVKFCFIKFYALSGTENRIEKRNFMTFAIIIPYIKAKSNRKKRFFEKNQLFYIEKFYRLYLAFFSRFRRIWRNGALAFDTGGSKLIGGPIPPINNDE
jgi:hypothetical protein